MYWRKSKIVITGVLLAAIVGSSSCTAVPSFDDGLNSIVNPYAFSIAQWELSAIPQEIDEWIFSRPEEVDSEVDTVTRYFSSIERIKALELVAAAIYSGDRQGDVASVEAELSRLRQETETMAPTVERIIGGQVRGTLAELGIYNPLLRIKVSFPPLNFRLSEMPRLLVVSPRDRIESMREITLKQTISLSEIVDIEAEVDRLGVSSLVVELGGLGGTLPTLVSNQYGLRFAIETAVHEWLHQYLVFTPLGFSYMLDNIGISRNYDIATIDETAVSMAGKEIGDMVYAEYYSQPDSNQDQGQELEFDFNREMRQIRLAVDEYLARGEVEQAEAFMEEKRQYLADNGYYIRKLNQAYFAFYGTYADSPTSVSPIGQDLKQLRSQSTSLKDFLDKASRFSSREDLQESIK